MDWRETEAGRKAWRQVLLLSAALLVFVGLIAFLLRAGRGQEPALRVICAAGLREPMTVVARNYEREFGIPVELRFGGSGALASQVKLSGGDVFFPADQAYLESLQEEGAVIGVTPVASLRAGLVVTAGNPKNLREFSDLGNEGVRLSLADETAAIGKLTWKILREEERWEAILRNVVVTKPTVNGVVEDVALGAVDATVAWDSVATPYDGVAWREITKLEDRGAVAAAAVVTASEMPDEAKRFVRYLVDEEKGARVFREMGFALVK